MDIEQIEYFDIVSRTVSTCAGFRWWTYEISINGRIYELSQNDFDNIPLFENGSYFTFKEFVNIHKLLETEKPD